MRQFKYIHENKILWQKYPKYVEYEIVSACMVMVMVDMRLWKWTLYGCNLTHPVTVLLESELVILLLSGSTINGGLICKTNSPQGY